MIALCGTSRHDRLSCSPPPRLLSRCCSRVLAATQRSRCRTKMATTARCPTTQLAPGSCSGGSRRLDNKPSRSPPPRFLRSEPDGSSMPTGHSMMLAGRSRLPNYKREVDHYFVEIFCTDSKLSLLETRNSSRNAIFVKSLFESALPVWLDYRPRSWARGNNQHGIIHESHL